MEVSSGRFWAGIGSTRWCKSLAAVAAAVAVVEVVERRSQRRKGGI